jgi:hypothetical protein
MSAHETQKRRLSRLALMSQNSSFPFISDEIVRATAPSVSRLLRRRDIRLEAPKPQPEQDKETRQFIETLEKTGQLVDVDEQQDPSQLPVRVTHVRYPDGTVKRIRFTGPGRR